MIYKLTELGEKLGCTYSNVSWLLRHGVLHGTRTPRGWDVSDEAIEDYLNNHKGTHIRTPKYVLHVGDKFGYWTVINADVKRDPKNGKRRVLTRCICGKERLSYILDLVHGRSQSCGCKRIRHPKQIAGKESGHQLAREVQAAGLAFSYGKKKLNKNSKTGHVGISQLRDGKYRAYITLDRKQKHLGVFEKIEDAIAARKEAEEKYFKPRQKKVEEIKRKHKLEWESRNGI